VILGDTFFYTFYVAVIRNRHISIKKPFLTKGLFEPPSIYERKRRLKAKKREVSRLPQFF